VGGADRIFGGRVTHFGAAEGLKISTVNCLLEDASGPMLAGTREGLYRLRGERFEPVDLPGGWNRRPIFALALDAKGGIWMGSLKDQLVRWDGKTLAPAQLPGPMASRFRHLQVDGAGQVWALCSEALYCMGRDQRWRKDPLPGLRHKARFRSFQVTADGELLLAMDADGAYLRPLGGEGRVLTYLDGLPREGVASIFRDSRGDLWLGSDGAGLLAEAVPGLLCLDKDLRTGMGLGMGTVLAFAEDGPGRMLVGGTSGLRLWEKGKGLVKAWDEAQGLPGNVVWSLTPRRAGGTWVGTLKGLAALDGGRIRKGPAPQNLAVPPYSFLSDTKIKVG